MSEEIEIITDTESFKNALKMELAEKDKKFIKVLNEIKVKMDLAMAWRDHQLSGNSNYISWNIPKPDQEMSEEEIKRFISYGREYEILEEIKKKLSDETPSLICKNCGKTEKEHPVIMKIIEEPFYREITCTKFEPKEETPSELFNCKVNKVNNLNNKNEVLE